MNQAIQVTPVQNTKKEKLGKGLRERFNNVEHVMRVAEVAGESHVAATSVKGSFMADLEGWR